VLCRFSHSEDQCDGLRHEPSRDEPEDLGRHAVQPLRVVDDAEQRTLLGRRRQQAQRRKRDQEPVGRLALSQTECDAKGVRLRRGQLIEPAQQGRAQLVDTGERELHLRFHTRDPRDAEPRCLPCGVVQQGGLPDPRLPAQDQRRAAAVANRREQPVEDFPLAIPVQQLGMDTRCHLGRKLDALRDSGKCERRETTAGERLCAILGPRQPACRSLSRR
jgi:hypothetical protein